MEKPESKGYRIGVDTVKSESVRDTRYLYFFQTRGNSD